MAPTVGFAAVLKYEDTALVYVKDISVSFETASHESTNRDSASGFAEYLPGIKRISSLTFDVNYDSEAATHDDTSGGLFDLYENSTTGTWEITMTDALPDKLSFEGFLTNLDLTWPLDGMVEGSVTVQPTGAPTWTAGI